MYIWQTRKMKQTCVFQIHFSRNKLQNSMDQEIESISSCTKAGVSKIYIKQINGTLSRLSRRCSQIIQPKAN